jgi:hypothetical protein
MPAEKIKYLLYEKGRYYYQRKVPKALLYYVGHSRWHIPVGDTFDSAQTAVAKLRGQHDDLIAKAKSDREERAKLLRAKEDREAKKLTKEHAKDDAYRADVLAVVGMEPFWLRTDEYLDALEHERTAKVATAICACPHNEVFTNEKIRGRSCAYPGTCQRRANQ